MSFQTSSAEAHQVVKSRRFQSPPRAFFGSRTSLPARPTLHETGCAADCQASVAPRLAWADLKLKMQAYWRQRSRSSLVMGRCRYRNAERCIMLALLLRGRDVKSSIFFLYDEPNPSNLRQATTENAYASRHTAPISPLHSSSTRNTSL